MPSSVPIFRPPHEVTIQPCALAHPHRPRSFHLARFSPPFFLVSFVRGSHFNFPPIILVLESRIRFPPPPRSRSFRQRVSIRDDSIRSSLRSSSPVIYFDRFVTTNLSVHENNKIRVRSFENWSRFFHPSWNRFVVGRVYVHIHECTIVNISITRRKRSRD